MIRVRDSVVVLVVCSLGALCLTGGSGRPADTAIVVEATSLRGKVMCGYQGWFRCPGDPAHQGWVHWSRNARRLIPDTLTFEMWPDVSEYPDSARFPAPGFTHPDGSPAALFTSDDAAVVLRHFEWMRSAEIDGAWLQHFVVDLPGGPAQDRYPSRRRVLDHVRSAAGATGRVWALTYDLSGVPAERAYDLLTADWTKLVDEKVIADPRYLRQGGKPVVEVFGYYHNNPSNSMTPELAERLFDFFRTPGPYAAYLVGGGEWHWRRNPDERWQEFFSRFDAYIPWNVGNYTRDATGVKHAATADWAADKRECERRGVTWVPVVYPGFGWDNLRRQKATTSTIPRRSGRFYWEQFQRLAELQVETVFLAMFDEVDEGTAIFKVTSTPPTQATFLGYEGLPPDWYLRLTAEGIRMLRGRRPVSAEIPIKP